MNAPSKGPVRPQTRGPVEILLEIVFGLFFVAMFSWFMGVVIEVIGINSIWKDQGEYHAKEMVVQDLGYIAAAPRSLLIRDTVKFSGQIVRWVEAPYLKLGIVEWYRRHHVYKVEVLPQDGLQLNRGLAKAEQSMGKMLSQWALISMYVAEDVLLRMSVALFSFPAFLLACMVGVVDGLVRRDLRRWGGGRESSFVYHHAKRYTRWALTGGFALYLTWPFGGFNPAYMVIVFTVLVAFSLSTTVAAFKKYV